MVIYQVKIELTRVLGIAAVSLILGFLVDHPFLLLLLGFCVYLAWILSQVIALAKWVSSDPPGEPPISSGIFEYIFERLFKLHRETEKRHQRLTLELERYRTLIADVRDGVVLIDDRSIIRWLNYQAESLLGLNRATDTGQALVNFIRSPEFVNYLDKRIYGDPLRIPSPRQPSHWLEFSFTRYEHGESLIVIRDVTRMQHLENMRRDFIANLSHELRTPLTVLRGYLETLTDQAFAPPIQKALGEMNRQSERMSHLLEDLTTLSRLESLAPPVHTEWLPIAGTIRQIVQETEQFKEYEKHPIELDVDDSVRLRGDAGELYSAFTNLIINAIKYTPAETPILIRWTADDSGGHFSVIDQGPGIELRHLPRLTERFYRVDPSRNSTTGGTGLGLAIVKHVLLRHDGRLQIQSMVGKGSTFSCHFPNERIRKEATLIPAV